MTDLIVHQPPMRSWGTPNLSPFCAKLECYLRIAEIPHSVVKADFRKAPKGKIPFVEIDGARMGDSQLIIETLERRLSTEGKRPLDEGLTAEQRAIGHLVRRALEEAVYFVALYTRWSSDEGYAVTRDEFKKMLPGMLVPIVRRLQNKKLHAQGTGRHTFDEVMALGTADFEAISAVLGDKPFLLGDQPRVVDCTLFGLLEALLGPPIENPLRGRVLGIANLAGFRKRIRERWWTDLPPLAV